MLLNPDKTFIAASDQIQHLPRVSSHLFPKKKKNQALILISQVDRKLHFLFVEKQQQKKYI